MYKQKLEQPLVRVGIWSVILVLTLMFWPREIMLSDIPETIVSAPVIYIEKTPDPEPLMAEIEIQPKVIETPKPRYGFTHDDIYLMTVLLCGSKNVDGDGEYDIDFGNRDDYEQISLVLSVVMNRVMSDKFPNTVSEVIWAKNQFHPMDRWRKKGLPEVSTESYDIVKNWCILYDYENIKAPSIPENHVYFSGNGTINRSRAKW